MRLGAAAGSTGLGLPVSSVDFDEVAEQLVWLDDEHDPEDESDLFDQLYADSPTTRSRRLGELPESPDDAYEE